MTDTIVSIRMPRSLAQELKRLAHQNHYLDVSEEIRSIVRQKAQSYFDPYSAELRRFRIELEKERSTKSKEKTTLAKDLERIARQLKDED